MKTRVTRVIFKHAHRKHSIRPKSGRILMRRVTTLHSIYQAYISLNFPHKLLVPNNSDDENTTRTHTLCPRQSLSLVCRVQQPQCTSAQQHWCTRQWRPHPACVSGARACACVPSLLYTLRESLTCWSLRARARTLPSLSLSARACRHARARAITLYNR